MDIQECLVETGLTGQEAALYLALCRQGQLTGYEAAKVCGISRSNAYHALSALVEKGGAYRVEGEPAAYVPVPPVEYVMNCRRRMEGILSRLERELPAAREPSAPFLTIQGRERVLEKMLGLIQGTRLRIYLSMAAAELALLIPELEAAAARGVKVVAVSDAPALPSAFIVYQRPKRAGLVRLIADSQHVLTGEMGPEAAMCVYSRNPALVQLIKDSLTDEMALAGRDGGAPEERRGAGMDTGRPS
jgi:sugar-specific transcriptional regulator TrmB